MFDWLFPQEHLSLKTLAQRHPWGSPERVVLHGVWARGRRRNPSMPYDNERRPEKAFERALIDLGLDPWEATAETMRRMFDHAYRIRHGITDRR